MSARAKKIRTTKAQKAEAREKIAELFSDATNAEKVIYSMTRHVMKGNAGGDYSFFVVRGGRVIDITWEIGRALDCIYDTQSDWVIRVGGVGFNRPFQIVYNLSMAVFDDPDALRNEHL